MRIDPDELACAGQERNDNSLGMVLAHPGFQGGDTHEIIFEIDSRLRTDQADGSLRPL
jgi:hypothetical protein